MTAAWIITRHEFLSRVRTRGFIISTLLAPLGLLVVLALPVILTEFASVHGIHRIAVVDQSPHNIAAKLVAWDTTLFFMSAQPQSQLRDLVLADSLTGYLVIPHDGLEHDSVVLFTRGGGGLGLHESVQEAVREVFRRERLLARGADTTLLNIIEQKTKIVRVKITHDRTERDQTAALTLFGYGMSVLVYILLFIYGGIVMRSVLEEKTNRIVEILASSARPFDIMLGKVVGVGAVGLFQVLLWIVLGVIVSIGIGSLLLSFSGTTNPAEALAYYRAHENDAATFILQMPSLSVGHFVAFVFFFIAGYVFYSALFAGIAAAADTEQDIQTLQAPVSIFIVLPMLTVPMIMAAPDATVAVALSLIPMFTPVLMLMRLFATEVPLWQVVLSVILMLGSIFGAVWIAGRIYRIGILRYGQRPSLRQLLRWVAEG
jgi:ABC-2 type transport system permease protein